MHGSNFYGYKRCNTAMSYFKFGYMKYQYYDINNSLFVFNMYFNFMRSNVPAVVEAKDMTIYFVPIYRIINSII